MCLTPLAVLWHSALRCRGIAFLMGLFSDLFGINSAMYIGVWSAIGLVLGMYLLGLTKKGCGVVQARIKVITDGKGLYPILSSPITELIKQ